MVTGCLIHGIVCLAGLFLLNLLSIKFGEVGSEFGEKSSNDFQFQGLVNFPKWSRRNMIQRIQSLYLFISAALSACLFIVPIYSLETLDVSGAVIPAGFQSYNATSNTVYIILNSISGIFAIVALFLFKNRNLQIRMCNLNMLIICIFTGAIFYFADHSKTNPGSIVHYAIGCYFPLVQLVLSFLAIRAIRKDEELVRSADRLRWVSR